MNTVTGTLIASYFVCKREVWFMAHELTPDQDDAFLEIGRLIEESFYKREEKGILLHNMKIDLIKSEGETLLVGEIKKSSSYEKPSIMQVAFYLYKLKENGIDAKGEVLIPKEKRKIRVELTKEIEDELTNAIEEIEEIINQEKPPEKYKNKFCKNCAYKEFCFA